MDIVKSERTGDSPNMGTRFERGGHGQRDGPFRNRITCVIRKLWLVKVEIPLKRPENPETPENPENCEASVPATAGALYVRGKWRLPRGVAYWALARGLLLEPRALARHAESRLTPQPIRNRPIECFDKYHPVLTNTTP